MSDAAQAPAASPTPPAGNGAAASAPAAAPAASTPAAAPAAPAGTDLLADPPAADGKPADGKPAADSKPDAKDGKDAKPDDKPAGAPEKYEPFTLPEGVQLDEARVGKFTEWAKSNNLTQEAAQEAMAMLGDSLKDTGAKVQEQLQATLVETGNKWASEAKADKEIGGDKFDENLAVAKKALDQFATPELRTLLVASKLGNHPEMLRAFFRIGKAMSEDGFVPGRAGAQGGSSLAQRMYPNMNP